MAPVWEKLAEHYADNSNVRIAKMDSTKNEVEEIRIQSFPTIKYVSPDGQLIDYNNGRMLGHFIAFIDAKLSGNSENNENIPEESTDGYEELEPEILEGEEPEMLEGEEEVELNEEDEGYEMDEF